jgi:ASC-1-like (ASCH) protein
MTVMTVGLAVRRQDCPRRQDARHTLGVNLRERANRENHEQHRPAQPKRELNIRMPYLELIAGGVKTVEVRVGYPRMRAIAAGQELTFVSGERRVPTRVIRVTGHPSFDAMLDREDPRSIGGDLGDNKDELLAVIRGIYPPEKERLGVLAIEVELTA